MIQITKFRVVIQKVIQIVPNLAMACPSVATGLSGVYLSPRDVCSVVQNRIDGPECGPTPW